MLSREYRQDLREKLYEFGYFAMEVDNPKLTSEFFKDLYDLDIRRDTMPEEAFDKYIDKFFKED